MNNLVRVLLFSIMIPALAGTSSAAMDHSFIEGPFESGSQVTETCLQCHEDASAQVMQTTHWTWETEQIIDGKPVKRGKKNVLNNFCISVKSNEPRCTSCHVGYGWADDSFDFSNPTKVDCLVCHDTTGTYRKPGAGAGQPAGYTGKASMDQKPVDLAYVAQNVGKPQRDDCLVCHANGGGGNNVKHGDIDQSLIEPTMAVDYHMGTDSLDFTCQDCHTTEDHQIPGSSLIVSPNNTEPVTCEQCHTAAPHEERLLNNHVASVTCQTCHIPEFAKVHGTKMTWDWSQSEKRPKDQLVEKDEHGHKVYIAKKGRFTYEQNVIPEYRWYNGSAGAYSLGDKINPDETTLLNYPLGSISDADSRIMPFKVHRGKQIYDTEHMHLITPKVFGYKGDTEAYWTNYLQIGAEAAWDKAAAAGMKASGLPYSGHFDFAPTATYWSINHMVAPADQSLGCLDCHGDHGRLNWQDLGYQGDPLNNPEYARTR